MNSTTRKKRVHKALAEMPNDKEFSSADLQAIMVKQYKISTLTTRAIGIELGRLPNVSRAGKRTWIKRNMNEM